MNTTHDTATTTTHTPATGERPPMVWPSFKARNALKLIDFLVDTLGFQRTAVYAEGGVVLHAQLDWPEGGGVMLGDDREGAQCHLPPGKFNAYVVTDRARELSERLAAAGVEFSRDYQEMDYGGDGFSILDPEGNQWSFGSYRGESPKP
ncbi:VOC family protein [Streptomyces sp. NPDC050560]|uniref:VOC family protein n=1 Tax=Streptomyces sp. NPDC050560 TaxID=3365630 RepID=UPI0037B2FC42